MEREIGVHSGFDREVFVRRRERDFEVFARAPLSTVVEDYKQIIEPMMKRRNSNRKMKTELRVDLTIYFRPNAFGCGVSASTCFVIV